MLSNQPTIPASTLPERGCYEAIGVRSGTATAGLIPGRPHRDDFGSGLEDPLSRPFERAAAAAATVDAYDDSSDHGFRPFARTIDATRAGHAPIRTGGLDHAELAGLVRRTADRADQRRQHVELTAAGRALLERL
jgi:hypothetical protein